MELEEINELSTEELGWLLLNNLKSNMPQDFRDGQYVVSRTITFHDAKNGLEPTVEQGQRVANEIRFEHERILAEGWQWLEQEGLIVIDPIQDNSTFKVITRSGQAVASREDLIEFAAARHIPLSLHPDILLTARPQFIRKDYETAVMHSFRSVEIAVRLHGGFSDGDVGVALMRDAFRPVGDATARKPVGPLTDIASEAGEQSGMMSLYAGAIACFRNPSAHRLVNIDKSEAIELLCFASRLLKIIDAQSPNP